jgi:signal transduction histidine kinase
LANTFNELLARIEIAFQAQKMFLSNVAHELRNPLTVITTQLQIALEKDRSPESYRATLGSVLEDVRALNNTSAKLMQIAQVEGNQQIKMQPIRVDELIWQAKQAVLASYPEAQIELEIDALPEREEELMVMANEALLRIALQNLFENACKFSKLQPVFVILNADAPDTIQLTIADNGIGIPQAERDKVFQPFFRASNTEHIKGSGVGLSLVQRIVHLHHAQLNIAANLPVGTVISISLKKHV